MLTLNWIYFVCIGGILLLFGLLWLWYDWRDSKFFQRDRNRFLFYCIKCGELFHGGRDEKECDCPECGHRNLRLRF